MLLEDCSLNTSLLLLIGTWLNGVAVGIVVSTRFQRWWRHG